MDRLLSSSFLRWFLFTLRVLVWFIFFFVFALARWRRNIPEKTSVCGLYRGTDSHSGNTRLLLTFDFFSASQTCRVSRVHTSTTAQESLWFSEAWSDISIWILNHPWINYNLRSSDLWSTVSTFTCTRINNQSPDHSGSRVNSFMRFALSDYENSDKHTFFCTIFRLTRCTINVEEADVFSARVHNVTRKSIILKIQREERSDDRSFCHVDSMFLLYVTYLERNPTNSPNHVNPSNLNIILKE